MLGPPISPIMLTYPFFPMKLSLVLPAFFIPFTVQSACLIPGLQSSNFWANPVSQVTHEPPSSAIQIPSSPEENFQLARRYLAGQGVPVDERKAFALMQSAAMHQHPEAISSLGFFYAQGINVEKDQVEAMKYLEKAARLGEAKAQLNLGLLLLNRISPEPDVAAGLHWVKQAADQGLANAISTEGAIFLLGLYGQPSDYGRAFEKLTAAAAKEDSNAAFLLGGAYEKGLGWKADAKLAERWYREAARKGHRGAQSKLARILDPQSHDPQRRIEALSWLLLAAEQRDPESEQLLTGIFFSLDKVELVKANEKARQMAVAPKTL